MQEIFEQIQAILQNETVNLSRAEYRDLLHEVISECRTSLNAMDDDGIDDED